MELADKLTHRQFTTLAFWVKDQINQPSRSDYYIMRLTAAVRSYLEQTTISVDQCKLSWNFKYQTDDLPTINLEEQRLNRDAELRTMAALGITGAW